MFLTKRGRIAAYLKTASPSPFHDLLAQWHTGQMQERLEALGLRKPEFHIDWRPDYKCIDIQGRRDRLYVDIQIEPASFSIAMDADEPDDPTEYALASAEGFYDTLREAL